MKRNRIWPVLTIILFGGFVLYNFFNWIRFDNQADVERMKQARLQREQAGTLIDQYLRLDQPSEADLAGLLGQAAVRHHGGQALILRMNQPFEKFNLQAADIDPAEHRRMFGLLETLAATAGVSSGPGQTPDQLVGDGLVTLMKIYDLADDLESALAVQERLKALPPEEEHSRTAQSFGAYHLAKLYGRAGRLEKAEEMLTEMRELRSPEFIYYEAAIYRHLAVAWVKADRPDRAAQYHQQLRALGSGLGLPLYRRREIAWHRAEVIQILEPACHQAGDRPQARALRTELEQIMNDPDLAPFVKYHLENRPFI